MNADSSLSREELLSILELGKALTSVLEPDRLYETIIHKISELLPAHNWSLLLIDEATGELFFEISINLDLAPLREVRLKKGEGVAGRCVELQQSLIVPDVRECPFFSPLVEQLTGFPTKSILCAPLVFGGRTVGVLEVVNPENLNHGAMEKVEFIADYAAIAVENTRRHSRIQEMAIHDNLTGLYNTRYMYQALADLFENQKATGAPFSLVFMDVDDFKRVVDAYGHLNGSRVLQEMAETIQGALTEEAFGISYGGDEFVVILPGAGKEKALEKAEDIRKKVSRTSFLCSLGHDIRLTASYGIASCPRDADDLTGLLALADRAMFDIKKRGKNAVGSV
ncbi:MAG: sensor domain-containing diguanylate cyclase [Pseudomonadota bacterium]